MKLINVQVITHVDEYGFQGRDHHPEASDLGEKVVVAAMHYESNIFGTAITGAELVGQIETRERNVFRTDEIFMVMECVFLTGPKKGQLVTLIDHEVSNEK